MERKSDPLVRLLAYIDTLHVTCYGQLSKRDGEQLRRAAPNRVIISSRKVLWGSGFFFVTVVKIQQPQKNDLLILDDIQQRMNGWMSRLDVAFDLTSKSLTYEEQVKFLRERLLLLNRRAAPIYEFDDTAYFNFCAHIRRLAKDLVLYVDQRSKLPFIDLPRVPHADLRFRGRATIEKMQRNRSIVRVSDLLNACPAKIFETNLRFTSFDASRWRNERAIEDMRKYYSAATTSAYRKGKDALEREINARLLREFTYVQRIHDCFPTIQMPPFHHRIALPQEWSWCARPGLKRKWQDDEETDDEVIQVLNSKNII